ncbi:hypothetical protein JCM16138_15100 [Thermococcus atlanticus]
MKTQKDIIIQLFENNMEYLKLLGRAWEVLYFEGHSPDVGKRRENFIIQMLKKEFNLNIIQALDTEREWDFKIILEDKTERYYNLKTTEGYSTVKLAWDGFPTVERILNFKFHYNILYVVGNKKEHTIEMSVISIDDLKEIQRKTTEKTIGDYWWIPRSGTNPRGFGLNTKTVKRLVEKAKERGNHIKTSYDPVPPAKINELKDKYFEEWYELVKKIAMEGQ